MGRQVSFLERVKSGEVLVSDGATGTNLQARGLRDGKSSENWVLESPGEIVMLHKEFVEAGSDIILTCTFGGTPLRLEHAGLAGRAEEVNKLAVELAREASQGTGALVAGSMGPIGQMLKPLGPLEETEAEKAYKEQAALLADAGVDLFVVETQYDLKEAKIAVEAVRSVSDAPLVCSFSYDRGTRTMMGISPGQVGREFEENGTVDLIGINCGRSLEDNLNALKELRETTGLPVWFKPNAGVPKIDKEGNTVFDVDPEQMGQQAPEWLKAGAAVVGGCCGSSPGHVRQIALAARGTGGS